MRGKGHKELKKILKVDSKLFRVLLNPIAFTLTSITVIIQLQSCTFFLKKNIRIKVEKNHLEINK